MTIQEKAEAVDRLYKNKDFQTIILDDFINQGILTTVLQEGAKNEAVTYQLEARRILFQHLYGIIDDAEKLKLDNEDN